MLAYPIDRSLPHRDGVYGFQQGNSRAEGTRTTGTWTNVVRRTPVGSLIGHRVFSPSMRTSRGKRA